MSPNPPHPNRPQCLCTFQKIIKNVRLLTSLSNFINTTFLTTVELEGCHYFFVICWQIVISSYLDTQLALIFFLIFIEKLMILF